MEGQRLQQHPVIILRFAAFLCADDANGAKQFHPIALVTELAGNTADADAR